MPWHTPPQLAPRPAADSLVRRYSRDRANTVDLPGPVVLRSRTGDLHLQLFLSFLHRGLVGQQVQYA